VIIVPITQNVDRIIRAKDYDFLKSDELLVTSVFRTIQGEGPYAGQVAVFVRLAGCNYGDKMAHCAGCDTSFQFDKGRVMTHADLLKEIKALPGFSLEDILVVTGGEPTLQPSLLDFFRKARGYFHAMQIETNGSQASFFKQYAERRAADLSFPWVSIVVSPKAAALPAGRYAQLSPVVLSNASCLKFVLSSVEEDPHHEVPDWAIACKNSYDNPLLVYVSPLAVYAKAYDGEVASAWEDGLLDRKATAANYSYAAAYAMKHNLRLSIQQHLFLGVA
jgi:7-carboxy-7-deazaguanine synthase